MKRTTEAITHSIDMVNEWFGKVVCLLLVPVVLLTTIEVILRYAFNRPTIWAWDIVIQSAAALAILAGGYTLLHKGHVAVDILVVHRSPRTIAILDIVTFPLFLFAVGALFWKATTEAAVSVVTREIYDSLWSPIIYPLRILIVVGILLLLLQGIAKFIRDLSAILHGGSRSEQ